MTSIGQVFYSGWEGIDISKNIENALEMGEAVKQVALPIIESLGNKAFNALAEVGQLGARVVAFTVVGAAVVFSGVVLASLVGAFSFVIYKMVTEAPAEEVARAVVLSEAKEEEIVEDKETLLEERKVIEEDLINTIEPQLDSASSYEKLDVAISSGEIY